MKQFRKPALVLFMSALAIMILASCGGENPIVTNSPQPAITPSPTPLDPVSPQPSAEPEPAGPSGVNPLTGLPIDEKYVNTRPVAVMLNNLRAALPQYGNSRADLIYEIPAEGMITRMVAVYQDPYDIDQIGSVRSTRPYYLQIAHGLDAILIHAGGSPQAYNEISARKISNIDGISYDGTYFWRDKARVKAKKYEHSMFTSGDLIKTGIEKLKYRTEHNPGEGPKYKFSDFAVPAYGEDAKLVTIKYPGKYKTGTFEYSAADKNYKISQYGAPYNDGGSGTDVTAVNLLFLKTTVYNIKGDKYGRLEVDLKTGTGFYACGGKYIPIKWYKNGYSAQFVYELENGEELTFSRGNSYISIIPSNTDLIFS